MNHKASRVRPKALHANTRKKPSVVSCTDAEKLQERNSKLLKQVICVEERCYCKWQKMEERIDHPKPWKSSCLDRASC